MAEVASAYVTLIPSAKGFASGIQGQLGGTLNKAGVTGGKEFGTGMKTGVASMASKVFLPLTVALGALGLGKLVAGQLSDAVTAGSDFQQSLGGADAVFKKDAKGIKTSADLAANALGLSKTAYLELATVLGAGLKNKGVKGYAKQTQSLIGIGADLAAQFGGSTSDAVDALASAMRGESDPIEKYGISLNEAAISAELVAQGVKKGKGGFTEQQKTMARLALITKQSADAQGTFARESDTYAGKQQRLAAGIDNIKTAVGGALLPGLTKLSDWFLKKGLPAAQAFGGWLTDKLWPAIKTGWETVRPAFNEAKDIIMKAFGGESGKTVEDFANFIVENLIPAFARFVKFELPQIAAGIAAVIEVVQSLWAAFQFLMGVVKTVGNVVLNVFINLNRAVATMLEALSHVPGFGWAKDAADKLNTAADKAEGLKDAINDIPSNKNVTVSVAYKSTGASRFRNDGVGYAPGRAKGGPVRAGQPYMVGEKGPELIVPRYNGKVIPNHEAATASLGGSGLDYLRLEDAFAAGASRISPVVGVRDIARGNARVVNSRQEW